MMNKTTILCVMAVLCLNFRLQAQENKAVDVTLKGIQIGQQVPDVVINNLHNYRDRNGKVTSSAKLSDFRGKLLILDFWATWCAPCIAMIPKMDSLQRVFGDRVAFVSVSTEDALTVNAFFANLAKVNGRGYSLVHSVGNSELKQLFPHKYLPHYVWIDGDGKLLATTGYAEVSSGRIEKLLQGQRGNIRIKRDQIVKFDSSRPLFGPQNFSTYSSFGYRAGLTGFIGGIGGGSHISAVDTIKGRRVTAWNYSIPKLLALAHGRGSGLLNRNRIELEVKDRYPLEGPTTYDGFDKWKDANSFCYELEVSPKHMDRIFELMASDLLNLFPRYTAKVVRKKVKCLVLRRNSKEDRLASKGGQTKYEFGRLNISLRNNTIANLVKYLDRMAFGHTPYPFVDGTGYIGRIDLDITADIRDLAALRRELVRYGLEIVEELREVDKLVVSDRKVGGR